VRHVMVLKTLLSQIPPRPAPEDATPVAKRPVRK
jgi:rod shape-determining protein MreC